ncbi:uncharacterized protein ACN427_014274 [Glossina fuscipes fuscipes]
MVDAAIKNLKERGGSSLLAIKKYINGTYKCDSQKLAPFIKKYLKSSVASGKLIQTKGKGASGSFKLSAAATKDPKGKASVSGSEKKAKEKIVSAVDKKKKKSVTATKKGASAVSEKKSSASMAPSKKVTAAAAAATKKTSEKKKSEKANVKNIKKVGTVKAKPTKAAIKATATKPKAPKAKTATIVKPKKATTTVAAKKTTMKKIAVGKK